MNKQAALDLLDFIQESPTSFHAVQSIKRRLIANGFQQLFSGEEWHIEHGKKYFVTKKPFIALRLYPGQREYCRGRLQIDLRTQRFTHVQNQACP